MMLIMSCLAMAEDGLLLSRGHCHCTKRFVGVIGLAEFGIPPFE